MICGVDEAGRGALAGPVVAAAVVLDQDTRNSLESGGRIKDSKQLTPAQREKVALEIYGLAEAIGIGAIDNEEIDRINILQASLKAMRQAVWRANTNLANDTGNEISYVYVDGPYDIPDLNIYQESVIQGDDIIFEISVASIVAKVYRDRAMHGFHRMYPQYHFKKHKGYGTRLHRTILKSLGPCPIHRKTFRGVKDADHRLS